MGGRLDPQQPKAPSPDKASGVGEEPRHDVGLHGCGCGLKAPPDPASLLASYHELVIWCEVADDDIDDGNTEHRD